MKTDKKPYKKTEAKPYKKTEAKPYSKTEANPYKKTETKPVQRTVMPQQPAEDKSDREDFVENNQLEGRNAVLEALNHESPIDKIFFKKGEIEGMLRVVLAKAKDAGVVTQEVSKQKLDAMSQTGNHQGVIALCPAREYVEVSDILQMAKEKGEKPFLLILDGITDPHNFGAILRSAEACGVHGVIIPKRRSVTLSAVVAKTSAGAVEYVPVARVVNLTAVIKELKNNGIWVACADMEGESLITANMEAPLAIVVGAEGEGVSRLVKENCDFSVKIPMMGKIQSLNASVAASILMFEVVRQSSKGLNKGH